MKFANFAILQLVHTSSVSLQLARMTFFGISTSHDLREFCDTPTRTHDVVNLQLVRVTFVNRHLTCVTFVNLQLVRVTFVNLREYRETCSAPVICKHLRESAWKGTLHKDHEDHTAGKRIKSFKHYNIVHKLTPMPQAMIIPEAKAAVDKELEKTPENTGMAAYRNKKEVIAEARKESKTAHFTSLMDIMVQYGRPSRSS